MVEPGDVVTGDVCPRGGTPRRADQPNRASSGGPFASAARLPVFCRSCRIEFPPNAAPDMARPRLPRTVDIRGCIRR
jgi:hypothetical protein